MELPECLKDGVGGWLAPHALGLMLAYSHVDGVGKEVAAKLLCSGLKLVAHYGQATATVLELPEEAGDARIGLGGVERMVKVVVAKGL
jgi:hypothetical protein